MRATVAWVAKAEWPCRKVWRWTTERGKRHGWPETTGSDSHHLPLVVLQQKAYAEEMRETVPGRRCGPVVRPLAGRGWIETACLVAESEPAKRRAYKELIIRRMAAG